MADLHRLANRLVRQVGHVAPDGRVEIDLAVLDELRDRDGRPHLVHRPEVEARVDRVRHVAGAIGHARRRRSRSGVPFFATRTTPENAPLFARSSSHGSRSRRSRSPNRVGNRETAESGKRG